MFPGKYYRLCSSRMEITHLLLSLVYWKRRCRVLRGRWMTSVPETTGCAAYRNTARQPDLFSRRFQHSLLFLFILSNCRNRNLYTKQIRSNIVTNKLTNISHPVPESMCSKNKTKKNSRGIIGGASKTTMCSLVGRQLTLARVPNCSKTTAQIF